MSSRARAGIFGYDVRRATPVAVQTVREWLEEGDHAELIDAVIFCVFSESDRNLYNAYMPIFFPLVE